MNNVSTKIWAKEFRTLEEAVLEMNRRGKNKKCKFYLKKIGTRYLAIQIWNKREKLGMRDEFETERDFGNEIGYAKFESTTWGDWAR